MAIESEVNDLESYHRSKIDSQEVFHSKIVSILRMRTETPPVLVPNGLQVSRTLYLQRTLQKTIYTSSSTHDNYISIYGTGPENGVCIWSKKIDEMKMKKQKKLLDCRITNFLYVPWNYLFFASCDDLTVRTYDNQFREYSRLQLQHSILSMIYDRENATIITSSIGFVQQWELNHCLHEPPIMMRQIQLKDHVSGVTPWISFLYKDEKRNHILALTGNAIFFLDAANLYQTAFLENRHTFPLTTCLTFSPRQYLITGSKEGAIKIWSMYMKSFPYVGCFSGHRKKIINLAIHPKENVLISASEDSTIRFWRIETFTETYRFDVLDTLVDVILANSNTLYYTSSRSVHILDLNIFHYFFTLIGSKITDIRLSQSNCKPTCVMILAEDEGIRLVSPIHGHIMTMTFPVVTHKPTGYTYDLSEQNIYILLDNGGVMVVCAKTNPCRTVQLWEPNTLDDKIMSLQVIQWKTSSEDISLLFCAHFDGRISLLKGQGYTMKCISPKRGAITKIEPSPSSTQEIYNFLTCNSDNGVTLWKIVGCGQNKISLTLFKDIRLEQKPDQIAIAHAVIAVGTKKRLRVYKLNRKYQNEFSVTVATHAKDESHRASITHVCGGIKLRILASASKDGHVKIWNTNCCLIRELAFGNTLSGVCFANNRGDLLIGFQNNLHYVPATEYLPSHYLEVLLNEKAINDSIDYCIPFDPLLRFWYDSRRVETISISALKLQDRENKRHPSKSLMHKSITECAITTDSPCCPIEDSIGTTNSIQSIFQSSAKCAAPRSLKMLKKLYENKKMENFFLDCNKSENIYREKQLPTEQKKNHTEKDDHTEVVSYPEQYGHIDELTRQTDLDLSVNEMPHKKYWPCAPDGYIPNSIIRNTFVPRPPINVVEPWKPRVRVKIDNKILCHGLDYFKDEILCWFSDEKDDSIQYDDWLDLSIEVQEKTPAKQEKKTVKQEKKTVKQEKEAVKKPAKEKERIIEEDPKKFKMREEISKHPPTWVTPSKENIIEETTEELAKDDSRIIIPPPYDKYYNHDWFPKEIGFEVRPMIDALLLKLDPEEPMRVKEILKCIVDINRLRGIDRARLNSIIAALVVMIDNSSGQLRHYAVIALCALGENRREIVLKLISKLNDPVAEVRMEVKKAIEKMAGINSAGTLISTLKEYGALVDVQKTNDKEVIESFRDNITSKRNSLNDRLTKFYATYNERDAKVSGWLTEMSKPASTKKERKRVSRDNRHMSISSSKRKSKKRKSRDQHLSDNEVEPSILDNLSSSLKKDKPAGAKIDKKMSTMQEHDETMNQHKPSDNTRHGNIDIDFTSDVQLKNENKEILEQLSENGSSNVTTKDDIVNNMKSPNQNDNNSFQNKAMGVINKDAKARAINNNKSTNQNEYTSILTNSDSIPRQTKKSGVSVADQAFVYNEINKNKKSSTGIEQLSDKNSNRIHHQKTLQTDESDEVSTDWKMYLNKILKESTEENVDDVVRSVAPLLFEKFSNPKSNSLTLKFSSMKPLPFDAQRPVNLDKCNLPSCANDKTSIDANNSKLKVNEIVQRNQKSGTENEKEQKLEQLVLATALSALRSRRRNSKAFSKSGIITNEALNDINTLLKLFQNKENVNEDLDEDILHLVMTLRQEMELNEDDKMDIPDKIRMTLIPSPVQRNKVAGVAGERIVSRLKLLPQISGKTESRAKRMKSIPERHGNFTVSTEDGYTEYGLLQFHWTTYTASYDMGMNYRSKFNNHNKSNSTCETDKKANSSSLPVRMKKRLTNTPINFHLNDSKFNSHTVLPNIETCGKHSKMKFNFCTPIPPPPTAEETETK